MGIRCDQFVDLTIEANNFLNLHQISPEICGCCKRPYPIEHEVIGHFEGMFNEIFPLYRYILKDGRTADVFHQASPWSSGPVHHLGLRVSDGTEFVWTEEEIEENSR